MLLRNIGPMRVGVPATFETEIDSPIGGGKLRASGQVELVSVDPGLAKIRISSTSNPHDLALLVRSVMQSMLANFAGEAAERAKLTEGLKAMDDMSLTDQLDMEIELPSGLARHIV